MRRFVKWATMLVVVMLIALTAVAAASADGVLKATIYGNTRIGYIGPCGFSMSYAGTVGAGNAVNLDASSFQGVTNYGTRYGTVPPCSVAQWYIVNDVSITWLSTSDTAATLWTSNDEYEPFEIYDAEVGCTYILEDPVDLSATIDKYHYWSGSGQGLGDGVCSFAPASLSVADGTWTPSP